MLAGGIKRVRERYSSSDDSSSSYHPRSVPRWNFEMPPSPTRLDDEASESVYSFQEVETEYVQDTSDTCSKSDADSFTAGEELELATSSSEQDKSDGSTSTGLSNTYFEIVPISKEDLGLLADTSRDSTDVAGRDPEVPKGDYWTCALCKSSNNNPFYRYCEKCFQVRKSYFPPRPRPKEKKRHRPKNSLEAALFRVGKRDRADSKELSSNEEETKSTKAPIVPASQDRESIASTSYNSQESVRSTADSGISQLSSEAMDALCNSCDARPKDGVFVHNNSGHNWCCYKCAKKIWKKTNRCPVCNRTVMKVIKLFRD